MFKDCQLAHLASRFDGYRDDSRREFESTGFQCQIAVTKTLDQINK